MENNIETLKNEAKGRIKFNYNGQEIYEWEQSLEEILIYIKAPDCLHEENLKKIKQSLKPGEQPPKLEVTFQPKHLKIGLKGLPAYLDEDLSSTIKPSESFWLIEGKEITITLTKAIKGETWISVFKGHDELNVIQKEEIQKKLLRERFQEEHVGFDFSDAEISGNVPDPRKFMGGIK